MTKTSCSVPDHRTAPTASPICGGQCLGCTFGRCRLPRNHDGNCACANLARYGLKPHYDEAGRWVEPYLKDGQVETMLRSE